MTYLDELRRELLNVGIKGAFALRILTEVDDHIRCDPAQSNPAATLGEPKLVAGRFADELRIVRTRRASYLSFGALSVVGVLVVASAVGRGSAGYPALSGGRATVVALSALALVALAQVALVAGTLALARARRATEPADLRLAQRRSFVALLAGAGACASLAVHAAVLPSPAWWLVLAFATAAVPVPILGAALRSVAAARSITPAGSGAAGLSGDLPAALARYSGASLALLGCAAVTVIAVGSAVAERSVSEGVIRGAIEAGGLLAGVAGLGRVLGLRR